MLHAKFLTLSFIEPELFAIEGYIARIRISTVLLLCLWTGPEDLHIGTGSVLPCKYTVCANIKFLCQGFWKLLSDRHTDIQTSYAWSLPVTWPRWRSHHSIRHIWKPHDTCKPDVSTFYRTGAMGDWSLHYRKNKFPPFLLLWPWRWPWPNELYIQTRSVFPGDTPDELPTWKLSKVIVWQTYRQSDKLRVVISGHVTTMAIIIYSCSKTPCYTQTWWLSLLQNRSYGQSKITLQE